LRSLRIADSEQRNRSQRACKTRRSNRTLYPRRSATSSQRGRPASNRFRYPSTIRYPMSGIRRAPQARKPPPAFTGPRSLAKFCVIGLGRRRTFLAHFCGASPESTTGRAGKAALFRQRRCRESAGRSVQAAGRRIFAFQTVCGSLQRSCKRSTIWLKKPGLVYDLFEKI
jgi:hypothetical protein